MKRLKDLLLTGLLVIIAVPCGAFATNTLWEHFDGHLPSLSDRAVIAKKAGIEQYKGTYNQNIKLLSYLENGSNKLGANIPPSLIPWTLSQPISSSQTTIPLSAVTDNKGNVITGTDLPTNVFMVIDPTSKSNSEIVMCPSSGYSSSSSSFSSCTRGLPFSGSSVASVAANRLVHSSGASVIISNVGQFYNNFLDLDSNQTVGGIKTFTSFPVVSTSSPVSDGQVASKKYVDDTVLSGAPKATNSTYGVVKLSSAMVDPTAPIVLNSEEVSATTAANKVVRANAAGFISTGFVSDGTSSGLEAGGSTGTQIKIKTNGGITRDTNGLSLNSGTGAYNAVQLDSNGKLPAIDGSQLTNAHVVFKNGVFTKDLSDASGPQTIAHGLGIVPNRVYIYCKHPSGGNAYWDESSYGYYNGSSKALEYNWIDPSGNQQSLSTSTAAMISLYNSTNLQDATIATDATNITLTWTKTNSPTGNAYCVWEAN